jgi:hypothetical protein
MREIIVKYKGECKRCGNVLDIGQPAMYEKSMGIFCMGHEPINVEEIRSFRMAKAERKAERYEEWAEKREIKANGQLNSMPEIRHDWAFITQPGHIPLRAKMNQADNRAYESLQIAEGFKEKAENLRHVRVAGDAERNRQAKRDALDKLIAKGTKVFDAVFGEGTVLSIHKKSYRIQFNSKCGPDQFFICARDKSYVRPLEN